MAQLGELIRQEVAEVTVEAAAGRHFYREADAREDAVIRSGFATLRETFRTSAGWTAFLDSWERLWASADAAADRQAERTLLEIERLGASLALRLGQKEAASSANEAA